MKPSPDDSGITTLLDPVEIKAQVVEQAQSTDQVLEDILHSQVPLIEEVSRYTIFSGGKRLRPVLYMITGRALGGDPSPRQAATFEYLHAASLLHDDVIDLAGLRRGKPAARVKYGNAEVILVGDFLFSKSYALTAELDNTEFVTAFAECTTRMAEGQILELKHTDDLELTLERYYEIIEGKTAVLLAAATRMGAMAAGADPRFIKAMYDYGMELGLAFQMVDDALDYVGTAHEFGKPVGHDLEEGKITLPFMYARDHAEPAVRKRLFELARGHNQDEKALEEAKDIIRASGGVEATYRTARDHAIKAQAALKALPDKECPEYKLLYSLPWYVIYRRR